MKNKQTTIIVMAVLLVALVAVYMFVSGLSGSTGSSADTGDTESTYAVSAFSASLIKSISFTNEGVLYSFVRDGSGWKYDADDKFPVDADVLDDIASALSAIEGTREIDVEDGSLEEYGLDDPLHTIEVKLTDSICYTYKIGDYNKHTDSYYLTSSEKDKIYTVIGEFESLFDVELFDMLLLDKMDSITASTVTKIEAVCPDGAKITLLVQEKQEDDDTTSNTTSGNSTSAETLEYIHTNSHGGTVTLDATAGEKAVSTLCRLSLDKCADYYAIDDQLSEYGLDAASRYSLTVYYTVQVSTTDSTTGITTKTDVDKSYTYYIGVVEVEQEKESADTDADTSADTGADTSEDESQTTTVIKKFVQLDGSNMIFEVDISGADVFFD